MKTIKSHIVLFFIIFYNHSVSYSVKHNSQIGINIGCPIAIKDEKYLNRHFQQNVLYLNNKIDNNDFRDKNGHSKMLKSNIISSIFLDNLFTWLRNKYIYKTRLHYGGELYYRHTFFFNNYFGFNIKGGFAYSRLVSLKMNKNDFIYGGYKNIKDILLQLGMINNVQGVFLDYLSKNKQDFCKNVCKHFAKSIEDKYNQVEKILIDTNNIFIHVSSINFPISLGLTFNFTGENGFLPEYTHYLKNHRHVIQCNFGIEIMKFLTSITLTDKNNSKLINFSNNLPSLNFGLRTFIDVSYEFTFKNSIFINIGSNIKFTPVLFYGFMVRNKMKEILRSLPDDDTKFIHIMPYIGFGYEFFNVINDNSPEYIPKDDNYDEDD